VKRSVTRKKAKRAPARAPKPRRSGRGVQAGPIEVHEIESLRGELERVARATGPPRWNADPDEVRRAVVKLVLTLVELIRQLLERQAIRRMEANTLTAEEVEAVGLALMRLEQTVAEIGKMFDIAPEDLNLDLGPIGKLM
jgi:regulator of sirC expression with transglutaminase-like and TPR domain